VKLAECSAVGPSVSYLNVKANIGAHAEGVNDFVEKQEAVFRRKVI
jgi:hypothetical protein